MILDMRTGKHTQEIGRKTDERVMARRAITLIGLLDAVMSMRGIRDVVEAVLGTVLMTG